MSADKLKITKVGHNDSITIFIGSEDTVGYKITNFIGDDVIQDTRPNDTVSINIGFNKSAVMTYNPNAEKTEISIQVGRASDDDIFLNKLYMSSLKKGLETPFLRCLYIQNSRNLEGQFEAKRQKIIALSGGTMMNYESFGTKGSTDNDSGYVKYSLSFVSVEDIEIGENKEQDSFNEYIEFAKAMRAKNV